MSEREHYIEACYWETLLVSLMEISTDTDTEAYREYSSARDHHLMMANKRS